MIYVGASCRRYEWDVPNTNGTDVTNGMCRIRMRLMSRMGCAEYE